MAIIKHSNTYHGKTSIANIGNILTIKLTLSVHDWGIMVYVDEQYHTSGNIFHSKHKFPFTKECTSYKQIIDKINKTYSTNF